MYWLNVDFPTNISKLHEERCRYCKPKASLTKELGKIGRAGGWLRFGSIEEAKKYYDSNLENMIWQPCRVCLSELVDHF
jgi:hypothetical protein